MLQVKNIEKYYGNKNQVTKALDRVSFDVADGEFIAIMGASGSGKTTLLNCISTIDTISAGSILLDEVDLSDLSEKKLARFRRERLGFVFQDFNLLDTLTIEENIGLTLSLNHKNPKSVQTKVEKIARTLGITDILKNFPVKSPADKNSAPPVPAPWWPDSLSCWPTNRQERSTPKPLKICWRS